MYQPPSTFNTCPVMASLNPEQRKAQTRAISSARSNAIDVDVMRAEYPRQRASQPDHPAFGCHIVRQAGRTQVERNGRDVYDPAGLPLQHARKHGLRAMEHALQVGVLHLIPVLRGHSEERPPGTT